MDPTLDHLTHAAYFVQAVAAVDEAARKDFHQENIFRKRTEAKLKKQAKSLGFQLVPTEA